VLGALSTYPDRAKRYREYPDLDAPPRTSKRVASKSVATRAITVRVRRGDLKKIMKDRALTTQSAAVNTLIAEEAARIRAWNAMKKTANTMTEDDFDARFL
jgi:hypothetical protein